MGCADSQTFPLGYTGHHSRLVALWIRKHLSANWQEVGAALFPLRLALQAEVLAWFPVDGGTRSVCSQQWTEGQGFGGTGAIQVTGFATY